MARIKYSIEEDGTVTNETVGAIEDTVTHDKLEKALRDIAALLGGDVETRKTREHVHVHGTHTHVHKRTA